jgi:hypothetical protein
MKVYTKEELKEILEKHSLWIKDHPQGEKADLTGANLTGADLRWADLTEANLTRANLRGADLREANLRWADLTGANLAGADLREANLTEANLTRANLAGADLREANLRWADLTGANLAGAIGNNDQIKIIQTGKYTVVWTKDKIWIGCKSFTLEEWKNKTESEILEMDSKALDFYKEWKDILLSMFEKFNNQ